MSQLVAASVLPPDLYYFTKQTERAMKTYADPVARPRCLRALIEFIKMRSVTCNQPSYGRVSAPIFRNASLALFITILLPFSILIKERNYIRRREKKEGKQTHGTSLSALLKMHLCVSSYISTFQGSPYFMLLALSSLHDGSP